MSTQPVGNTPQKKPGNSGGIWLFLFLAATPLFCLWMLKLGEDPVDVARQQQAAAQQEKADTQQAQDQQQAKKNADDQQATQDNEVTDLGGEGVLQGAPLQKGGKSDIVALAQSQDDLDAFVKANSASDTYGIKDLVNSGRVFSIPSGQVRAKKLDSNWTGGIEVRILTGEHQGEASWTNAESLQKP